jgi:hypothetical protein
LVIQCYLQAGITYLPVLCRTCTRNCPANMGAKFTARNKTQAWSAPSLELLIFALSRPTARRKFDAACYQHLIIACSKHRSGCVRVFKLEAVDCLSNPIQDRGYCLSERASSKTSLQIHFPRQKKQLPLTTQSSLSMYLLIQGRFSASLLIEGKRPAL